MLNITRLNPMGRSAKGGRAAVIEYMMATEYYMGPDGKHATAQWIGDGASALGLKGQKVTREAMDMLARGFAPDGTPLCRNAGEDPIWVTKLDKEGKPLLDDDGEDQGYWKGGHRIGFDFTLSPPKGVSVLYADSSPEQREKILDVHHHARDVALGVIQDYMETRRGHAGATVIGAPGLVASAHTHFAARAAGEEGPDPQIHDHVLIYNAAQGTDGEWSTLEPSEVYRVHRMIDAVYCAEVAIGLQRELHVGIEKAPEIDDDGKETGQISFRVAGISRDTELRFSGRRNQIIAYQEENGGTRQDASLATRAQKDEPPYDELVEHWGKSLARARVEDPSMFRSADDLIGQRSLTQSIDDDALIGKLHEHEAVWTREDLIQRLACENVGIMSGRDALREADDFIKRNDLVEINPMRADDGTGARRETQPRYAARWWIDGIEGDMLEQARARRDDTQVRIDPKMVDEAVEAFEKERGFKLQPEQRSAVDTLTSETGGLAILSGRAGTGKTTSMEVAVSAMRRAGHEPIGCSTSWNAARKLEAETGMESYSTARLLSDLDSGKTTLHDKSVVIMDEAGMAGSVDIARLGRYVNNAGAKLILAGDAEQLQPIAAGSLYRLLQQEVPPATLKEIRRQHDPEDRQMVEGHYAGTGHRTREEQQRQSHELFDALDKRGLVDRYATRKQALKATAKLYCESEKPIDKKIAIANTRADVRELNARIHATRHAAGEVGEEHTFDVIDYGKRIAITASPGDWVRLAERNDEMGVINGTYAEITAIEDERIQARVHSAIEKEDGRQITIDPEKYRHFNLGYAGTVYSAQAQTCTVAYHLASSKMTNRHLSLVAASRARERYMLVGSAGDLEVVRERMAQDQLRVNALEEGRMGIAPTPEQKMHAVRDAQQRLATDAEEQRRHFRMQRQQAHHL